MSYKEELEKELSVLKGPSLMGVIKHDEGVIELREKRCPCPNAQKEYIDQRIEKLKARLESLKNRKQTQWGDLPEMMCKFEKGKKEVDIAQMSEILRILNEKTGGWLKWYVENAGITNDEVQELAETT